MLYAVTAQSHYRAMALLTSDDKYNGQIADAKTTFVDLLDAMDQADPADAAAFRRSAGGQRRSTRPRARGSWPCTTAGDLPGRHASSTSSRSTRSRTCSRRRCDELIDSADQQMTTAQAAFESDRHLLTTAVVAFSVVSVAVALLLGFVLSWAFILPVRKMASALAAITAGDSRPAGRGAEPR